MTTASGMAAAAAPGRRLARWGGWVAAGLLLALVALAYLDPHLMLDIADQLWACF